LTISDLQHLMQFGNKRSSGSFSFLTLFVFCSMMRGLGVSCFRIAIIFPRPALGCRTAKSASNGDLFQTNKSPYGLLRTRAAFSDDRPPAPRIKIPSQSADVYKAKQSLGQNFLVDSNVARKIVASLEDSSEGGKCVVEVGPGKGSLTALLLAQVRLSIPSTFSVANKSEIRVFTIY
jgi:hypothetical protein